MSLFHYFEDVPIHKKGRVTVTHKEIVKDHSPTCSLFKRLQRPELCQVETSNQGLHLALSCTQRYKKSTGHALLPSKACYPSPRSKAKYLGSGEAIQHMMLVLQIVVNISVHHIVLIYSIYALTLRVLLRHGMSECCLHSLPIPFSTLKHIQTICYHVSKPNT